MRVELQVDGAGPSKRKVFPPAEGYVNLRKQPQAFQQVCAADANPPLGRFLEIINGAESLFASFAAKAGETPAQPATPAPAGFGSSVILVFADPTLNHQRDRYEHLAVQLSGLLLREPAEALTCELAVAGCEFPAESKSGHCLKIALLARAETAEQARVRWGLGLARVQQALLYCSRQIRLKLREVE
ncbi:MAG: hypothetical protein WBF06_04380 [Candidatus Acidiferrales bacterium]